MEAANASTALNKRALIIHDGLTFLSLLAVSVTLFGVTLFLFRSFQSHREDLGAEWAEHGRLALQHGSPEEAVTSLRTSLTYAPDEEPNQLLLAQALAQAGHTEEATNYFLGLWEERPGDGFINLQLARLSAGEHDWDKAIDYYRASVFGSWEGDGVTRRREVRLELVDLLTQQRQFTQARNVLFIVAGNSPQDVPLNLLVAQKLQATGNSADALAFYEKALATDSRNQQALIRGGELAYSLGDYRKAQTLLERAVEEKPAPPDDATLTALLANAHRIQELTLSRDQPAAERANHILLASTIAQTRLKACMTHALPAGHNTSPATPVPQPLKALSEAWTAAASGSHSHQRLMLESAVTQDAWTQLIYQTEQSTSQACGEPAGDDALLLRLANSQPAGSGKD